MENKKHLPFNKSIRYKTPYNIISEEKKHTISYHLGGDLFLLQLNI